MEVGQIVAQMALDYRQYNRDLDRLEGEARSRGRSIGDIFKNALSVTIGMGLFEAVKRGFQLVARESVNFNAMMERSVIGFTTMLGSAEKAHSFLKEVQDFAAKTPFEFPELLDASKRMLAYGFSAEQVLPTMEAVGNATAALGLGAQGIGRIILALGQMKAKSKVTGEEMRQLTETGIPAWDILAKAMGKTVPEVMKLSEKGLIPADKAIQDFIDGMNERFPDMMKNMENTWDGVTSTIKDVWKMTLGAMTSGLFKNAVSSLQVVRDWASNFYDTFQRFGLHRALSDSFGTGFATAVEIVSATLRGLISVLRGVIGFLKHHAQIIRITIKLLVSYVIAVKAVTLATKAATAASAIFAAVNALIKGELATQIPLLSGLSKVIGIYRLQMALAASQGIVLTGVLARLRVAIYAVYTAFGPIGWALLAITGVLTAGISLWGKYNQSLKKASSGINALDTSTKGAADSTQAQADASNEQADAIDKAGKAAKKNMASFDEINQLTSADGGGGAGDIDVPGVGDVPGLGGVGGVDWDGMMEGLEEALETPQATFKGFLKWMWDGWSDYVQSWGWVQKLSDWIVDNFYDAERGVWGLQRIWKKWSDYVQSWNWVQNLSDWIVDTFYDAEQGVWSLKVVWQKWSEYVQSWGWVQGLTGWIVGVMEKWDGFKTNAGTTWENIKSTINTKWDDLKTNAGTTWDSIKTTIKTKWDDLKTDAPVVWDNIKTSLETRWGAIKTNAKNTWENVKTSVQTSWDNLKKDAPTAWENIKTTIATKTNDTWINLKKTWDEASKYTSKTWADVKTNSGTTWDNVKSLLAQKWNDIQATSNNTFSNIKTNAISAWNDIKNRAPGIWENIKNSMVNPLESAKQTLLNIVATIKNAFNNMRIEIPKPKLPHVSVSSKSKQVGDINVPYPDFSIDWYAQGGIFNSPSVIGVGEAGSEAVLPLDHNTGWMDSLAAKIAASIPGGQAGGDVYVYIGNDQIDAYIHRSQDRRNIRSNGR